MSIFIYYSVYIGTIILASKVLLIIYKYILFQHLDQNRFAILSYISGGDDNALFFDVAD